MNGLFPLPGLVPEEPVSPACLATVESINSVFMITQLVYVLVTSRWATVPVSMVDLAEMVG
ncbi:hypothetical protein ABZ780_24415 [Micromonospora sp. NPDC047467]|uniref:hypothetical protein n=1 Tax=Micromonospora sp. NPDC047467 TaxID=3154814 RepID=UPI0033C6B737